MLKVLRQIYGRNGFEPIESESWTKIFKIFTLVGGDKRGHTKDRVMDRCCGKVMEQGLWGKASSRGLQLSAKRPDRVGWGRMVGGPSEPHQGVFKPQRKRQKVRRIASGLPWRQLQRVCICQRERERESMNLGRQAKAGLWGDLLATF